MFILESVGVLPPVFTPRSLAPDPLKDNLLFHFWNSECVVGVIDANAELNKVTDVQPLHICNFVQFCILWCSEL
tara:strand:+ start:288 stop:509 length:222 start_codon:yes stop_codon:yes gene_type:complete